MKCPNCGYDYPNECDATCYHKHPISEWISVKDEKPPCGRGNMLIFFNGKREITYGYAYSKDNGWDTGSDSSIWINDFDRETNEIATHWMSLPKPPKHEDHV